MSDFHMILVGAGLDGEDLPVLQVPLEEGYPCEECGVEVGVGWAVLPDAICGSGCGVPAVCSACISSWYGPLPVAVPGLPSIPGITWEAWR